MKNISAILSADWHIRSDVPICRTDNYLQAQENKVKFILGLAEKYKCPILIAGDLGDKSQWRNWLLELIIKLFKEYDIIIIPGQHDLPNHQIALFEQSGIGVLDASEVVRVFFKPVIIKNTFGLFPFSYGEKIKSHKSTGRPNIAISHQMVIQKPLWPGQEAPKASSLLKKFPEYNLILTGDNHQSFVEEYDGRLLVNPGSMMRMEADEINHKPRVYLWDADSNEIEAVYLPIEQGVISREHIDLVQERDERIEAYVSHLKKDYEITLSFENNMEEFFRQNRVRKRVNEKVWEAMEV